ncbi:MAG: TIR domain-containing protein [Chloroflexi bacterium]|nr:TIR domain-containing protein [Chloroflexota bacterium]
MAYRNKTYVAFDADNDIIHYRMMQAWKASDNVSFNFYDAHDLNNLLPTSSEATIKRKLKERLKNTKLFMLLVGENTKNLHKFVRWEQEQALDLDIPVVVVNLNKKRKIDKDLCPAIMRDELAIHVSYHQKIIEYAIDNWIDSHRKYRKEERTGPFYYTKETYEKLGL